MITTRSPCPTCGLKVREITERDHRLGIAEIFAHECPEPWQFWTDDPGTDTAWQNESALEIYSCFDDASDVAQEAVEDNRIDLTEVYQYGESSLWARQMVGGEPATGKPVKLWVMFCQSVEISAGIELE